MTPAISMLLWLILQFIAMAGVLVLAGSVLALAADRIATVTGLGRALVGSLLLAAATSLPELTVCTSAAARGRVDVAVGDLLGACLMNLLMLATFDLLYRSRGRMLSRESASHALSGTVGMALAVVAALGIQTSKTLTLPSWLGVGFWSWLLIAFYALGSRLVFLDQRISARAAAGSLAGENEVSETGSSFATLRIPAAAFLGAAITVFLVGPRFADVAGELADHTGLGGTFVGTTFVAVCTSLPELVTSVMAVRIGAFDLLIGNIFGSNAFNIMLLAPVDFIYEGSLLADASSTHGVTALAIVLATAVAVLGQLYHAEYRRPVVEPDAVLMLMILGGAFLLVFQLS